MLEIQFGVCDEVWHRKLMFMIAVLQMFGHTCRLLHLLSLTHFGYVRYRTGD